MPKDKKRQHEQHEGIPTKGWTLNRWTERDWRIDLAVDSMSAEEFEDFLAKKERSLARVRGRERHSERWLAPTWNPEANLKATAQTIYSPAEFEADRSLVVVDPRLIEFLVAHPERLFALSPRQFEELVAEVMDKLGYSVQLGPSGRDGGVDVFAERDSDVGSELVLVQCKRFRQDRRVGEPIVKQLYADTFDRNATRGLVVTTSFFSSTALDYIERNRYRLAGADHDQLFRWINRLRQK